MIFNSLFSFIGFLPVSAFAILLDYFLILVTLGLLVSRKDKAFDYKTLWAIIVIFAPLGYVLYFIIKVNDSDTLN